MAKIASAPTERAEHLALIGLGLALVTLVIFFITFRGLWFLTLPLSLAAFILGSWGAISGERRARRAAGVVALVVGLLLLLLSIGALIVDLNVSDGWDVYEREG